MTPLDELLGGLRDAAEDADYAAAARWRERGGKVVGHFQVYFPEEIAHAAGMLPLKMRGAPIEAHGTLVSLSAGIRREFQTDSSGEHNLGSLPFGVYVLEVSRASFATETLVV